MSAAGSDDDEARADEGAATGDEPTTEKATAKKAATKKAATKKSASKKGGAEDSAASDEGEASEPVSFVEGNHQTVMTYGHGGFPKFIMAVWVCFLVGYAVYFYVYGLPDLTAWGSP